ncbi:MAG TPA: hypothetical protein PK523_09780 [Elusimicrobiales bacterium]|nr:hypothetical protein [Elusimicrobiales bacterium]
MHLPDLRALNILLFLCLGAALGYLLGRESPPPAAPCIPSARVRFQPADEIFSPEYRPGGADRDIKDIPETPRGGDPEYELELHPEENETGLFPPGGASPVTDGSEPAVRDIPAGIGPAD